LLGPAWRPKRVAAEQVAVARQASAAQLDGEGQSPA